MAPIVVLGSLNVDFVARLSRLPRRGETVLGPRLETFAGGKGANQAVAAARLGATVAMVGRVGADAFGGELLAGLEAAGVDASGVERDAREATGAALILVEEGGENLIAVTSGANALVGEADAARAAGRLGPGSLLVLQLEVPVAAARAAAAAAGPAGASVLLNAAPATALDDGLLRLVDTLVVNGLEAQALTGIEVSGRKSACAAARRALERGPRAAYVTLGAAGAALAHAGGTSFLDPFPVAAVDATAAGDAFVGALAAAQAGGLDLEAAGRAASAAGAAAATRAGAQASLPDRDDLERLFGVRMPPTTLRR